MPTALRQAEEVTQQMKAFLGPHERTLHGLPEFVMGCHNGDGKTALQLGNGAKNAICSLLTAFSDSLCRPLLNGIVKEMTAAVLKAFIETAIKLLQAVFHRVFLCFRSKCVTDRSWWATCLWYCNRTGNAHRERKISPLDPIRRAVKLTVTFCSLVNKHRLRGEDKWSEWWPGPAFHREEKRVHSFPPQPDPVLIPRAALLEILYSAYKIILLYHWERKKTILKTPCITGSFTNHELLGIG